MRANTPSLSNLLGYSLDAGRLLLVELLGEGAYGVVYRAVEQSTIGTSSKKSPAQYAVKVLRRADSSSAEGQCQNREIIVHKIVSEHPNVLTLHQVIEDDFFIYLVLEYCPGGDLYSAIAKRHSFCQNDALVKSVFVQILDAVQSCHEKGIYHRDLKPDNIFISGNDSKVFLGDFGLATDVEYSSAFSCGSRFYMSPECIGEEFNFAPYSTPTSDVWSLGVVLLNMIANRNPWNKATTNDERFYRYLSEKHFLQELFPISKPAAKLLARTFTFNAGDRITIPELRKEVMSIKTFFLTEREIASAEKHIKDAVAAYSPRIRQAVPKVIVKDTDLGACIFLQEDPYDEEYIFSSPDPDAPLQYIVPSSPLPTTTTLVDDGDSLFAGALSTCSSQSTEDGSAPVTPADTLVEDPMDVACLKDFEDDEIEREGKVESSGFSIKKAFASLFRPSLRQTIGVVEL